MSNELFITTTDKDVSNELKQLGFILINEIIVDNYGYWCFINNNKIDLSKSIVDKHKIKYTNEYTIMS